MASASNAAREARARPTNTNRSLHIQIDLVQHTGGEPSHSPKRGPLADSGRTHPVTSSRIGTGRPSRRNTAIGAG